MAVELTENDLSPVKMEERRALVQINRDKVRLQGKDVILKSRMRFVNIRLKRSFCTAVRLIPRTGCSDTIMSVLSGSGEWSSILWSSCTLR